MLIHFCVEKLPENTHIAVSALTSCQQFLNGSFFPNFLRDSQNTTKIKLSSIIFDIYNQVFINRFFMITLGQI